MSSTASPVPEACKPDQALMDAIANGDAAAVGQALRRGVPPAARFRKRPLLCCAAIVSRLLRVSV